MIKFLVFFGTRPEAIKLAPLIIELKKTDNEVIVCSTGQHDSLLNQVVNFFKIKVDCNLSVMKKGQSLSDLSSSILKKAHKLLLKIKPDSVIVHGDTSSTLYATIASFYLGIKVIHIEAGLRTFDLKKPFPEEMNRQFVSKLAFMHFCPTSQNKKNLLNEKIINNIYITGNTVVDALMIAKTKISKKDMIEQYNNQFLKKYGLNINKSKIITITCHRRENFGKNLKNICSALLELADVFNNHIFVLPVHPNPNVYSFIYSALGEKNNIFLLPPLSYDAFIFLMMHSFLLISDSGGLQEESPTLNKPLLVLRDVSERTEVVKKNMVKIIGTDKRNIINEVTYLLTDIKAYNKMIGKVNPYGDGSAAKKITNFILKNIKK